MSDFMYNPESGRKLRLFDLRKDPEDIRDYKFTTTIKDFAKRKEYLASLPSSIDWTNEMSPVKDQKFLGSCVAFSVAAVKEWQEQKEQQEEVFAGKDYKRLEKYYDLSESWIYWTCKKIDGIPDEEGTFLRSAMKVLNKVGVPCEKAWPYNDKVRGNPASWASLIARWSLTESYYRLENIDDIKGALVNGPCVIGIGCFEEIMNVGSDGIVPYPAQPEYCLGGHAVCLVSYDNDKQLVKFKNSWGDWGNNGYGYLSYNYIRDFMWDAWACKDMKVTKEMLKGASQILDIDIEE